jgi:hypothetical protein
MNTRQRLVAQVLVFLSLFALLGASAWAVPGFLDYQGKLSDSGGNPLTGTYSMTFRLYGVSNGGTHVWQEMKSVQVVNGIYSVLLGTVSPLGDAIFADDTLYLEVQVGTEVLSPRQQLASTGFAMRAGNAETLNGLAAGSFSLGTHSHSFPQITGAASDAQIPNNITIDYAASAGNADTVDGQHAAAFASSSHIHDGSQITTGTVADARIASTLTRDSEVMGIVTAGDGPGSGLNADFLDGLHASSFLSTSSDYGRSGVAADLYEGSTKLSDKYVNKPGGDTINGRLEIILMSMGSGWTEAIKGSLSGTSDGAGVYGYTNGTSTSGVFGGAEGSDGKAVSGTATGVNGVGILGTATGANGVGVKGTGPLWAGYFDGWMYVSGNVGIGKTNPDHKLHVAGISKFEVGSGSVAISTPGGWPGVIAYSPNGHRRDIAYFDDSMCITTSNSSSPPSYNNGIRIYENGNVGVKVLEITGGSDLSEQFDIRSSKEGLSPAPGMVVSIDPTEPGNLVISHQAYDRRVAGIISGAAGVQPGMLMGQRGTTADGANPVALTGRVYCQADASNGPIEPGDLLTTSDLPGHAMKVSDHARGQGAILGKAMTGLDRGTGLVLVLVSLQ